MENGISARKDLARPSKGLTCRCRLGTTVVRGGGYYPPYKMAGLTRENEEDEYVTDRVSKLAVEFHRKIPKKNLSSFILSHFSAHDPIQGRLDLVEKYQQKLTKLDPPKRPEFILEGNPDDPTPLSRQGPRRTDRWTNTRGPHSLTESHGEGETTSGQRSLCRHGRKHRSQLCTNHQHP